MSRAMSSAPTSGRATERSDDRWPALLARHQAALEVARGGAELDRELLLSYVIWPTEWIDAVTGSLVEPAIAA